MYTYAPETIDEQPPASWRPDLVPIILDWIDHIPAKDLRKVRRFAIGTQGQFVAYMVFKPKGQPSQDIRIELDHDLSLVQNTAKPEMGLVWNHAISYAEAADHFY